MPSEPGSWATKTMVSVGTAYPRGASSLPGRRSELILDCDGIWEQSECVQEVVLGCPRGVSKLPRRTGETFILDCDGLIEGSDSVKHLSPKIAIGSPAHGDTRAVSDKGQVANAISKPLSKQQMEEAAKLAERRKHFDNQRYQREQQDAKRMLQSGPLSLHAPACQSDLRRSGDGAAPQVAAAADVTAGLSLTESGARDLPRLGLHEGALLPGGIVEESEKIHVGTGRQVQNNHDDEHPVGFDDDDERMMVEILQACDDL